MSDAGFGYREGYAQLGSYRTGPWLRWIMVLRGDQDTPQAGSLEEWIAAYSPFSDLIMDADYEPSTVNRYPARAAVHHGERCRFPSVEAAALVSAGIARYA